MRTIVFFIFFFWVVNCSAQSPAITGKTNAISLELGKTGVIYNLVFDHKLINKNFGFRLGIGSNLAKYLTAMTVGGGGYYLIGKEKKFLEIGADIQYLIINEVSDDQKGFALVYPDYSIKTFYTSANIGYKSYGKKTLFRFGVSPGFIKGEFIPGGYLSFGIVF